MIGDVLAFFRAHVDEHLRAELGESPEDPSADKVVFVDGDQFDPIAFKLGAVSELMINVEEERTLRSADPYAGQAADGSPARVQPPIRLNLYLLFVARFKRYDAAWNHLSKIVEHFQTVRVLDRDTTPALPAGVDKLVLELVTLGLAEQNEIWNALRTTYHPSILYRVKLVVLRDRQPQAQVPIAESSVVVGRMP